MSPHVQTHIGKLSSTLAHDVRIPKHSCERYLCCLQSDPPALDGVLQWRLHDVVAAFLSECAVTDWRPRLEEKDPTKPSQAGLPSSREVQATSLHAFPKLHMLLNMVYSRVAQRAESAEVTCLDTVWCRRTSQWETDTCQGLGQAPLQTAMRRRSVQSC